MENKHVTNLLPEYLDGTLDQSRQGEVVQHLKGCATCLRDMKQLQTLFQAFEKEGKEVPGERLRSNFYAFMEQEAQQSQAVIPIPRRAWIASMLKVAAGVVLLISSFLLGKHQQEQQSNQTIDALLAQSTDIKQTAMLSLMENRSASKRIQGVNYIEEFTDPDNAIVDALIRRMLIDENNNVRLAAVNALQPFNTSASVTGAYIKALETEKDPGIQLVLIRILVGIREKKAIQPIQQLLEDNHTQDFVKEHIKSLLPTIV